MAGERYERMTGDDEYAYVLEILSRTSGASLLGVPGVLEMLREEWNNEILDCFERDHPEEFLDDEEEGDEWVDPFAEVAL